MFRIGKSCRVSLATLDVDDENVDDDDDEEEDGVEEVEAREKVWRARGRFSLWALWEGANVDCGVSGAKACRGVHCSA